MCKCQTLANTISDDLLPVMFLPESHLQGERHTLLRGHANTINETVMGKLKQEEQDMQSLTMWTLAHPVVPDCREGSQYMHAR